MLTAAKQLLFSGTSTGIRDLTLANVITDATRRAAVEGDGLSVPGGFGVWPAATNLLNTAGIETSFEAGKTGWAAAAAATLTRITTDFKFGDACLEVVTAGAGSDGANTTALALTTATAYTASAWIKSAAGDSIRLTFRNAAFAIVATATVAGNGTWQRCTLTYTTVATESHYVFIDESNNVGVAKTFYIDGAQVETGSVATPFTPTSRSAARAQVAVERLFTPTQGAVLFRSDASPIPSNFPVYFSWADDSNNRIECYIDAGDVTALRYAVAGSAVSRAGTATSAFTGFIKWSATALGASMDGSVFNTTANTNIPTLAATSADLGSRQYGGASLHISTALRWAITFKGTPTDADAALPWMTQNAVPTLSQIAQLSAASKPTLLVPADTSRAILLPAYFGGVL